jgi:hypothetical protein
VETPNGSLPASRIVGVLRYAAGIAGIVLASPASIPLDLALARAMSGWWIAAAIIGVEAAGVAGAVWGLRSAPLAIVSLSIVNAPLLVAVAARDDGVRLLVLVLPKYLLLAGVGYVVWPGRSRRTLRWLAAILPTVALAWLFLVPLLMW